MNLTTVLHQLAGHNIKLWAEGDQLRVQAPKGAMTPALRDLLTTSKAELLAWLQSSGHDADNALPPIVPQPEERHQPFPLTDIQHAYWIGRSGALDLGNVSTHGYTEFEYTHLDIERLTTALNKVIARHEMLRAIVLPTGEQQILADTKPYLIPVLDLRGCSEAAQTEQLAAIRRELSHQLLPLDQNPLFDIRMTRLGDSRLLLHVSIDILLFDLGSFYIIFNEWRTFYENPHTFLPPVALSFRDYVLTEEKIKTTALYAKARDYWLKRIDALPPAPELPLAQTPTGVTEQIFCRRSYQLKAAPWQALKAKAQQLSISPSVLLLTAFATVLKEWCKQPRFSLNLTLFNRLPLHPEVSQLVGDFTSLTLLEIDYMTPISLAEQSKRLQHQLWEALEHRYFSGIAVMRELARRQHNPQAGAMPVVFTSSIGVGQESGKPFFSLFDGELRYGISQTPQVWLDHQIFEYQEGLLFNWDTVDALFPAGMLDEMFAAYCNLLEGLAVDAALWNNAHLSLLPAAQLAQRIAVNATHAPISAELLPTRFLQQVQARPTAPAVIAVDRTLTYQELYQYANQIGHWLRAQGIQANQLVAVVMEKGWEQVAAVLGIHLAGAAYLPIDPALPTERQHYLLQQGGATIALTQSYWAAQLTWPAAVQPLAVNTMAVDVTLPPLALVQQATDLAYVIYTSGSTGQPKGVVIDHRGAVNTVLDINRRFAVTAQDRVLALSALNFDLSVYDIFGLLAVGGAIVMPDPDLRTDPAHWVDLMGKHGVTLWDTVPALMQMLVDYVEARQGDKVTGWQGDKASGNHPVTPSPLHLVMLSGDWIPVTLPDRIQALWSGVTVYGLGGATEASIWSNYFLIEQVDPTWQSIPYGVPLTNQSFQVLDANLNPRPVWVAGDLYIGGIGLALGYWKDQAKSNERFIIHPRSGERLYRTGDLARYLPDGVLEFLGREDFQVKIRGHRIELGEIESTLLQHPAIKEAVVNAVGDPKGNRQLVAYVVHDAAIQDLAIDNGATQTPDRYTLDESQDGAQAGFITDPLARLEFKLGQLGVRSFNGDSGNSPLANQSGIQLSPVAFDEARRATWLARQSYRTFVDELIPLATFSELLSCLIQMPMPDAPLPKYRYPSAGNLYPVQTYLYIKPARIEGLPGGFYYHHPQQHRLLPLSSADTSIPSLYAGPNRPIFEQAAFSIFLVADMDAIVPMYGEIARDFVLLEAGYMSQLLMMEASQHLLGLCPIGGGVDVSTVQRALALGNNHQILPNSLLGGRIDPIQRTHWLQNSPKEKSEGVSSPQLQKFLKARLPDYMVPALYIPLAALPLTPNGKVDRKALPDPTFALAESRTVIAPRTATEQMLAALWCGLLKQEQVSIYDDFFTIGGDSLLMTQVMASLRTQMQLTLPLRIFFEKNTIADLAEYIDFQTTAFRMAAVGQLAADEEEGIL